MNEVRGQNALFESATERSPGARRLPQHTVSNLLIPVSQALDLAEGRAPGHANRVAYIAMSLAGVMELNSDLQLATLYASLLHDIGTIPAGADLAGFTRGDERLVFASLPLLTPGRGSRRRFRHTGSHRRPRCGPRDARCAGGPRAWTLRMRSPKAIATHHERWDGGGYPRGLSGAAVPDGLAASSACRPRRGADRPDDAAAGAT